MDEELTGRRRYRETPCGFVVEVEYAHFVKTLGIWKCFWRNANAADLSGGETLLMHNESE